jgi:hypothetical protein
MYGPPLEITSNGDLLVWVGLASLAMLMLSALIYPRLLHH